MISNNKVLVIFFILFSGGIKNICLYCSRQLVNDVDILLDHSKSCHYMPRPNTDHTFVCSYCAYYSIHKCSMRKHLRLHTGDKPYKCIYCEYSSNESSNVRKHCQIRHTIEFQKEAIQTRPLFSTVNSHTL